MADNFLNSFDAMDHVFDGHGDMTSSGSLRFDVDFGRSAREVWFSRKRPEEESLDLDDAREAERLEREKGLDTRESFDDLIAVGMRQDISLRESLDIEDVAHKVIADLREGVETLPEYDHTRLQVLRALEDRDARMTREWNTQRATLEEEFTAAAAKGESLSPEKLVLLEAFRKLHSVAPFISDRPDLLPARKLYEVAIQQSWQQEAGRVRMLASPTTEEKDFVWAIDILEAGHSLPEILEQKRQTLIALGTSATDYQLMLLDVLKVVHENAPFGPAYPKQTTHLGRDWKEQLDTNRDDVFDLELGHTNLSSIEKDFIKDLESENFMGTGKKTFFWLKEIKYDPAATPAMISGLIDTHGNGKEPSPDRPTFAKRLKEIARDLKYVQGQIKRQAGIEHSFEQMVAGETLPVPKIKRELGRLWRNMKRGGGLSLSKASDIEKVLAGLAVVGITWFLSSHEKGKKIGGVFVKGGLGVGVLAGLNVLSGAVLKGKTATEWADKKFALAGRPVDDSIYRIFERHADGKDRDEREQNISYIGDLMKMAGTNNTFGSILEKYKAAKANDTNRIYLDGISDDGMLGDLKKAPSEAAFIAMDIFYRRYGAEIERYEATHDGETPLKELSFTNVVMRLIAADSEYKDKKYPFLWLANKLGDGAEYTMDKIETGFDRVGEALSPKKAKLRKYLKETLFADETKYGTEVNIPRDEHVVILPGGIQTAFRFAEGEKEQDKSPGKELTGFVLEKVDGTPVTFHFNELDPDSVQAFAKQLIIDTGKKKAKESRSLAERRGLDKFNSRSHTLRWNTTTHKWMLPSVIAGEETYTIGGAPVTVPERSQNLFVHSFNQDRGTFGINFFTLSEYWKDPTNVPHHSLEELESKMQEEEFQRWIAEEKLRGFPFSYQDIYIENWAAIRAGTATTIEGYSQAGAASLRFRGTPNGSDIEFAYVGVDNEQRRQIFSEKLELTTRKLKQLGKNMPEDWKSHWKRFFKLDFAGPFNEKQWELSVDQKREQIQGMIDAEDPSGALLVASADPAQRILVSGYIRDLDALALSMDESIALDEKADKTKFERQLRRLEGLGLSGTQKAEYNYLRIQAESNFNFDNENVKYAMLGLFVELTAEAASNDVTGNPNQENAQAYTSYISQSMINHLYKRGGHRVGQKILVGDITKLRGDIDTARTRSQSSVQPTGVMEGLNEWPTFTEYTDNLAQYQFATSVHMLERSWLEYTDLVTKSVFDKFRWRGASKYLDYNTEPSINSDMLNLPFSFGFDSSKKWGGLSGQFDLNNMGSPMLRSLMQWATSPSKWDLMLRPIDILGGDPQTMIDDLSYPALLRGSADFKRQLAIETEEFIRDNLSNVTNKTKPADFEKLYEKYDLMIRGTVDSEGLWDTYLKPELIGKDAVRGGGGGGESSPENPEVQQAKADATAAVKAAYSGADVRSVNTSRMPKVTVRFRHQSKTWDVDYDSTSKTLGRRRKVSTTPPPSPPETPGDIKQVVRSLVINKEGIKDSDIISVKSIGKRVTVTYNKGGQKFRVVYDTTTNPPKPGRPTPMP